MIMNCVHLRRPQCELLFLEIVRIIKSSSLIVLHGSQFILVRYVLGSLSSVMVPTDTEEATAGFLPSSWVSRETHNRSDLGRA